jgi:hypothetical protein
MKAVIQLHEAADQYPGGSKQKTRPTLNSRRVFYHSPYWWLHNWLVIMDIFIKKNFFSIIKNIPPLPHYVPL